ncbi:hypothetical protein CRE_12257 [Caenorhabditis remanei]|uniref:DUF38 domain-containing protein n=1 Tax=Caenorhabditis remanei TaxID=31234 RepID=E3N709_CAERE|nr:hypothetical protein CRE_12257 [Caenorhabditis remanei]
MPIIISNEYTKLLILEEAGFTQNISKCSYRITFPPPKDGSTLPFHLRNVNRELGLPYDVDRYGNMEKAWITAREDLGDILITDPTYDEEPVQLVKTSQNRQVVEHMVVCIKNDQVKEISDKSRKTMKIRDLMRQNLTALFPAGEVHKVEILEIVTTHGILRLPLGLQLEVQALSLRNNANNVINAISKILSKTSFPIKLIVVQVKGPTDPIFKNSIFRKCKKVEIEDQNEGGKWAETLIGMTQPTIRMIGTEVPMNDVLLMAKNWVETNREIGSVFSMITKKVQQRLAWLKEHLNAKDVIIEERSCPKYPRALSVPINDEIELNLFIQQQVPYDQFPSFVPNDLPYTIVMEVMKVGSAEPLNYCRYWYLTF